MKMGVSQQEIQDASNYVNKPGTYTVVFQGFKPKKAAKGDSVNLYPQVTVIGDPDQNGKQASYPLNFQASTWFIVKNFIHSFGIKEEVDAQGNESIPGDWIQPDPNKPETWSYNGPLMGKTAKWEFAPVTYDGKTNVKPKQFLCALNGCTEKHKDNLN